VTCAAAEGQAGEAAPSEPAGRNKPIAAFDPVRKAIVLFGGFGLGQPPVLPDAWERTDELWRPLERSRFPPRAAAGVTTDTRRGRVVLFGGQDPAGACGDTLEWDGKAWTRLAWTGPPARTGAPLAYDSRRGRAVLFGGLDARLSTLGDTWEWDGAQWTKRSDSGPTPRFNHAMAYDAARGRIVLFGGNQESRFDRDAPTRGLLDDTWEWDGATWTRSVGAGPDKRDHHSMAYDEGRARVVLFGGWVGRFLDDTWEWDGVWKRVEARGPSARGGLPSLVYHPEWKAVVLYGGWGDKGAETDTWRWDGNTWTLLTGPVPKNARR
jgi:hypothetical protein